MSLSNDTPTDNCGSKLLDVYWIVPPGCEVTPFNLNTADSILRSE